MNSQCRFYQPTNLNIFSSLYVDPQLYKFFTSFEERLYKINCLLFKYSITHVQRNLTICLYRASLRNRQIQLNKKRTGVDNLKNCLSAGDITSRADQFPCIDRTSLGRNNGASTSHLIHACCG